MAGLVPIDFQTPISVGGPVRPGDDTPLLTSHRDGGSSPCRRTTAADVAPLLDLADTARTP